MRAGGAGLLVHFSRPALKPRGVTFCDPRTEGSLKRKLPYVVTTFTSSKQLVNNHPMSVILTQAELNIDTARKSQFEL